MSKRHKSPSIIAFRPVIGLELHHVRRLNARLRRTGEFEAASVVRALSLPGNRRAGIILPEEPPQLFKENPEFEVTKQAMDRLRDRLWEELPDTARSAIGPIPLLPTAVYPPGTKRARGKTLLVAPSETVAKERKVGQRVICGAVELEEDEVPEGGVWLDDDYVTSVHLAQARTRADLAVVQRIDHELNRDDGELFEEDIMPRTRSVMLGPVVVMALS